jgi:hypothetical protein
VSNRPGNPAQLTASDVSIMDRVLGFLRAVAVWLVVAAWLLFVATAVMAFGATIGSAINATYFPYHPRTPIDQVSAQVWQYAVLACLLAAVASSIALALKRRRVASGLVLTVWGVCLMYAGWAMSVVKPGPEYFERYLGKRTYLVSWHYAPLGIQGPNQGRTDEFDINLCLNSLRGSYGESCVANDGTRVFVALREGGITPLGKLDERTWRAHMSEMQRAEPRYGHDAYVYKRTPDARGQTIITLYHVRQDAEGRLMRLVVCRQSGQCQHHALVDDYSLSYNASDSAFSMWETMDRNLADLINSWRIQ